MLGYNSIMDFLYSVLLSLPAILIAISFHEWAHAFAAYKLGDSTAKNMGRLSLDPIGFIALVIVGFGWAKPVMVNSNNFKRRRIDDTIVSLAGPFTNLILSFLSLGLWFLVVFGFGLYNPIVSTIIMNMVYINIALFVFNLIPLPPLDGYHVLKNSLLGKVRPDKFWKIESFGPLFLLALFILLRFTGVLSVVTGFVFNVINSFYVAILGI